MLLYIKNNDLFDDSVILNLVLIGEIILKEKNEAILSF